MLDKTDSSMENTFTVNQIIQGDALDVLKVFPDNTIDTVLTDPPYGLSNHFEKVIRKVFSEWLNGNDSYIPECRGFMGKSWDAFVPPPALWREVYRVMKPGGTILCFAGSRTQDLMAMSLRLAGFEIKDTILWLYGQGFPKSLDISKAIDKLNYKWKENLTKFGNYVKEQRIKGGLSKKDVEKNLGTNTAISWWEGRNYCGKFIVQLPDKKNYQKLKELLDLDDRFDYLIEWEEAKREVIGTHYSGIGKAFNNGEWGSGKDEVEDTIPATPEAKQWEGYGTSLKPSYEPIILAIKPNEGSYAENALKYEVAGLNIDEGRISYNGEKPNVGGRGKHTRGDGYGYKPLGENIQANKKGRFPANTLLECTCDEVIDGKHTNTECTCYMLDEQSGILKSGKLLSGHKQGKGMFGKIGGDKIINNYGGNTGGASRFFFCAKASRSERNMGKIANLHPTVKPLSLIEYLVKLTSMPNPDQIYLDPFLGSGTTAMACKKLGKKWIGIELLKEYVEIAEKRINAIPDRLL
jgi:DNA modification methylase